MKVTDPQRRTWRVSRRWMPWRRKTHMPDWDHPFPAGGGMDDPISVIIGVLILIIMIPLAVIGIVVALELLLLLLVLPFILIARMLCGRHWHVEVRERWTFAWEAEAGTWTQSRQMIEHVAEGLRQGMPPWQAAQPRPPAGTSPYGRPPSAYQQPRPTSPDQGQPPPGQPPPPPS